MILRLSTNLLLLFMINFVRVEGFNIPQDRSRLLYEETTQTHLDFDSCTPPKILWPRDGECYTINTRGPCELGSVIALSMETYQAHCKEETGSSQQATPEPRTPPTPPSSDPTLAPLALTSPPAAPSFAVNVSDTVTTLAGNTAYLDCTVRNLDDTSTVYWVRQRDYHVLSVGREIFTTDRRFTTIGHQDTMMLSIDEVGEKDAGTYLCQINNHPDLVKKFQLIVKANAGFKDPEAVSLTVSAGDSVNFNCDTKNIGENKVEWYYRSYYKITPNNTRVNIQSSGDENRLTIISARPADKGEYVCHVISNTDNFVIEKKFSLTVPDVGTLVENDRSCNEKQQVFWPLDKQCYSLLTQGPCEFKKWLIWDAVSFPPRARCALPLCEDTESQAYHPKLCQCVDKTEKIRSGRYSPEEVCGRHTKIVLNPLGQGSCTCEDGFFMDDEGRCHALGFQGPCKAGQVWELTGSGTLACVDRDEDIAIRVIDLIAHDTRRIKNVKCYLDSKKRCRRTLRLTMINRIDAQLAPETPLFAQVPSDAPNSKEQEDYDEIVNSDSTDENPFVDTAQPFLEWVGSFQTYDQTCQAKNCTSDSILWADGECYQAASTGPCDDNEWLLLDKFIDDRPILKCKDRRCPEDEVWWDQTCSCVPKVAEGRTGLSPCTDEGYRMMINPYGSGICGCAQGYTLDQFEGGVCVPQKVNLNAIVGARSGFQPGVSASPINCKVSESMVCGKGTNKNMTASELLDWLQSFATPSMDCESNDMEKIHKKELDCYKKDQVLFEGNCVDLLSSAPCKNNSKWVVMKRTGPHMLATCDLKPCPSAQEIFHQEDCKCYNSTNTGQVCAQGEQLWLNPYGHGMCGCQHGFVLFTDGKCYPVGSSGPCKDGKILIEVDLGEGRCAECPVDFVQISETESRKRRQISFHNDSPNKNVTTQSNTNSTLSLPKNRCFKLGEAGPCQDGSEVGLDVNFTVKCVPIKRSNTTHNTSTHSVNSTHNASPISVSDVNLRNAFDTSEKLISVEGRTSPSTCRTSPSTCRTSPSTCMVDMRGRCRRSSRGQRLSYSAWMEDFIGWAPDRKQCLYSLILPF